MKKLALAFCLLAVSFTAQAQFEKGTMILNPSVTGLDFSYSKNDDAKFGLGAQVGTFLADGFALMVNAGDSVSFKNTASLHNCLPISFVRL